MSIRLVTPDTNTLKCEYVLHVEGGNDMGHYDPQLRWEGGRPTNYKNYEQMARNYIYRNMNKYVKSYINSSNGINTQHYRIINHDNVVRMYLNDKVYCRMVFGD